MSGHEMNIIIVAIIFGSIFGIAALFILARLIKTWIKRNNSSYDEEKFERLAKAFVQYRKSTERRLKKLEKGETDQANVSGTSLKEDRLQEATQIKTDNEKNKSKTEGGSLRNMLRE